MSQFLAAIAARFREMFSPELLASSVASWGENLLFAVLTFLVYYALWRIVPILLVPVLKRLDVDATGRSFFQTTARVVILTLGLVAALGELGINTASLITSLGVAGLTIGFAARDALSNIISGVFIFWDRPFVLGDLIEIKDKYGRVDRITLRSTRVVTVEGKMLAIPNAEVVNSTVASYTNFPHLRLDVSVTIGVAEDLGRVRELLLGVVRGDDDFMEEPAPELVVNEINDYNLLVTLRAWLRDERQHIGKRFQLRERAFEALRTAGVDMPNETIKNLVTLPEGMRMAS
ncbi:MAG: mechanosensitive ion channel family protein [Gemmatimonadetes bacterium]|nr:mechanosensitive ion channel family protein [Gemmatimonadota bacterium]